jgi:hypothetical protein
VDRDDPRRLQDFHEAERRLGEHLTGLIGVARHLQRDQQVECEPGDHQRVGVLLGGQLTGHLLIERQRAEAG